MGFTIPISLTNKKKEKARSAAFAKYVKEHTNQPPEWKPLYTLSHKTKAANLMSLSGNKPETQSASLNVPPATTSPFSFGQSISIVPNAISTSPQQSATTYPYQITTTPNTSATPYTTTPQQQPQNPLQGYAPYYPQNPIVPNSAPFQQYYPPQQFIPNTDPWDGWSLGSKTAPSPTTKFLNPDGFRGRLVAYAVYKEPSFDNPKEGILFVRMCGKWKLLDPATFSIISSGSEGSWDNVKQYFTIKNYIVNNETKIIKEQQIDRFSDLEIVSADEAEA